MWVLSSEYNWVAGTIVSAEDKDTEAMVRTSDRQVRFFTLPFTHLNLKFSVSPSTCYVQGPKI